MYNLYKNTSRGWKWVAVREKESHALEESDRRRRIWGKKHVVVEMEDPPKYLVDIPELDEKTTREQAIKVYQNVEGIGPATAEKLYDRFGSLLNIVEETPVLEVDGIGPATRERLLKYHE